MGGMASSFPGLSHFHILQNFKSQMVERLGVSRQKKRNIFFSSFFLFFLPTHTLNFLGKWKQASSIIHSFYYLLVQCLLWVRCCTGCLGYSTCFQGGVAGFSGRERSKQNTAIHWVLQSPKRTKTFIMGLVCIPQGLLSALYKGGSTALCPFLYKQRLHSVVWNICTTTERIQSQGEIICGNKCIWR